VPRDGLDVVRFHAEVHEHGHHGVTKIMESYVLHVLQVGRRTQARECRLRLQECLDLVN
jgi:hypothetical protein